MKITEFEIGQTIYDAWGNTLQVDKILKTRVKVKIVEFNKDDDFIYPHNSLGDIITYQSSLFPLLYKERRK